jgi:hypothetical protein
VAFGRGVRAAARVRPLTPLSPGRDARLEGLVLRLPGPIDEQSPEQARSGADAGAEPGIAANRANYRATPSADGGAGQCALLGRGHIGTSSDGLSDGREQQ